MAENNGIPASVTAVPLSPAPEATSPTAVAAVSAMVPATGTAAVTPPPPAPTPPRAAAPPAGGSPPAAPRAGQTPKVDVARTQDAARTLLASSDGKPGVMVRSDVSPQGGAAPAVFTSLPHVVAAGNARKVSPDPAGGAAPPTPVRMGEQAASAMATPTEPRRLARNAPSHTAEGQGESSGAAPHKDPGSDQGVHAGAGTPPGTGPATPAAATSTGVAVRNDSPAPRSAPSPAVTANATNGDLLGPAQKKSRTAEPSPRQNGGSSTPVMGTPGRRRTAKGSPSLPRGPAGSEGLLGGARADAAWGGVGHAQQAQHAQQQTPSHQTSPRTPVLPMPPGPASQWGSVGSYGLPQGQMPHDQVALARLHGMLAGQVDPAVLAALGLSPGAGAQPVQHAANHVDQTAMGLLGMTSSTPWPYQASLAALGLQPGSAGSVMSTPQQLLAQQVQQAQQTRPSGVSPGAGPPLSLADLVSLAATGGPQALQVQAQLARAAGQLMPPPEMSLPGSTLGGAHGVYNPASQQYHGMPMSVAIALGISSGSMSQPGNCLPQNLQPPGGMLPNQGQGFDLASLARAQSGGGQVDPNAVAQALEFFRAALSANPSAGGGLPPPPSGPF
jgi:hypothetical protein